MAAWILGLNTDTVAITGVTGMCLAAFVAALKLLSSGTERIDASAEARVDALERELDRAEKRHDAERARWDHERADLLSRLERSTEDP